MNTRTRTILASVDSDDPAPLRLVDRHAREGWPKYPSGALFLAIDYVRGAVVLVEKPSRGRPAAVRTLAPLADSDEPQPGCLTREDVLSLFRDDVEEDA